MCFSERCVLMNLCVYQVVLAALWSLTNLTDIIPGLNLKSFAEGSLGAPEIATSQVTFIVATSLAIGLVGFLGCFGVYRRNSNILFLFIIAQGVCLLGIGYNTYRAYQVVDQTDPAPTADEISILFLPYAGLGIFLFGSIILACFVRRDIYD